MYCRVAGKILLGLLVVGKVLLDVLEGRWDRWVVSHVGLHKTYYCEVYANRCEYFRRV